MSDDFLNQLSPRWNFPAAPQAAMSRVGPDEWIARPESAVRERVKICFGDEPRRVVWGRQTHGAAVARIGADFSAPEPASGVIRLPETDGIIIEDAETVAVIATADCVPLVVCDMDAPRAGVIHAGWRGTFGEILKEAMRKMCDAGGAIERLHVWIGPRIAQAHYEVSESMARDFLLKFPEAPGAVQGRLLDLGAVNRAQAMSMGVSPNNIKDCGADTFADCRLPSYRRDAEAAGRLLTMIRLPATAIKISATAG